MSIAVAPSELTPIARFSALCQETESTPDKVVRAAFLDLEFNTFEEILEAVGILKTYRPKVAAGIEKALTEAAKRKKP